LAQLFLGCGEEHVERKDAHFMVAGKEREKQSERERGQGERGWGQNIPFKACLPMTQFWFRIIPVFLIQDV
jgi:hypothetical protein